MAGKFPLPTLHCILSEKHRLDRPLTHVSAGGPPAPPEKAVPPPGHPLAQIHDGKPVILQTEIQTHIQKVREKQTRVRNRKTIRWWRERERETEGVTKEEASGGATVYAERFRSVCLGLSDAACTCTCTCSADRSGKEESDRRGKGAKKQIIKKRSGDR